MTEYTDNFDLVLYYTRKAVVKPIIPVFDDIKNSNPELDLDSLLDLFSLAREKYNRVLSNYEQNKADDDIIISEYIIVPDDNNILEKVNEIEKNELFIEWSKSTKNIIENLRINKYVSRHN